MVTQTKKMGKPVAVTATNANEGATVKAFNRTTGETITSTIASEKALLDMQNFDSGYTTGDVVELRIAGEYFGSSTLTLTATTGSPQSKDITLTQTTATNAPAINF